LRRLCDHTVLCCDVTTGTKKINHGCRDLCLADGPSPDADLSGALDNPGELKPTCSATASSGESHDACCPRALGDNCLFEAQQALQKVADGRNRHRSRQTAVESFHSLVKLTDRQCRCFTVVISGRGVRVGVIRQIQIRSQLNPRVQDPGIALLKVCADDRAPVLFMTSQVRDEIRGCSVCRFQLRQAQIVLECLMSLLNELQDVSDLLNTHSEILSPFR